MSGDYKKPQRIYAIISAINDVLSVSNDPRQLLEMVLDALLELLKVDCCWVQLFNAESRRLSLVADRGFTPDMKREIGLLEPGWNFGNKVAGVGHKIVIPDLSRDRQHGLLSFNREEFRWLVAVPVRTYHVLGVIGIGAQSKKPYEKEITDLLMVIAGLVGVAIDKANLFRRTLAIETRSGHDHHQPITSNPDNDDIDQELATELEQIAHEWITATDKAGKAAEQITRLATPPQTDPSTSQDYHPEVPAKAKKTGTVRVFVIDKDLLFRQGLISYLSQTDDIEVVGHSDDFSQDVISLLTEVTPDIVIMDANLPSFSGLYLALQINQYLPGLSVIMLTPYQDDNQIVEALKAGVAGYLNKNVTGDSIVSTVRSVFQGEPTIHNLLLEPAIARRVLQQLEDKGKENHSQPVCPEEVELLEYLAIGYSSNQGNHALNISEQEIIARTASIVSKLIARGLPDGNSRSPGSVS